MPDPDVRLELVSIRSSSRVGTANATPPVEPEPEPGPGPIAEPGPIFPITPGGTQVGEYREYLFENLPAGRYDLGVTVPNFNGLAPFSWSFDLPGDTMARMVAALWPVSFNPDSVGEVQITPRYVTVSPGEIVRFFGVATDVSGSQIPHSVSYMLVGDTGELAPRGMYTARRLGKSTITAWMNGKSATAEINVVP
jgi:hypothetical protein